jgi:hypothetical protein
MLFCPIDTSCELPERQVAQRAFGPMIGLVVLVVVSMGSGPVAKAGSEVRGPKAPPVMVKPTPTPKYQITNRPHLVAVGPMELSVKPVAGPRVRRAPLLPTPTPKPVIEAEIISTPAEPTATPKPAEPSAFSPDAAPTLLPTEKGASTPAPVAEKKDEKRESVLDTIEPREPELRDSVMYFETPVGPRGSRATIPMVVPFTSPPTAPQPESRATYRKEKE